ncbi:DNA mismatch repair protein MutT [Candidatus Parcubacteria bacterium]|nr:MAG: DNA mismatch repair protein MutT [Candidatus Parcubacteria bacterium]
MSERVRAIIVKENKLLSIKRIKKGETFWCCPGGMVENGETHETALKRECKEELGVDIELSDLFFKMASEKLETKGQMEYFYLAKIISGELGSGNGPEFQKDSGYQGSYQLEWLDIVDISNIDFRPSQLGQALTENI